MGSGERSDETTTFVERVFHNTMVKPVIWIRENIVEPNRPKYYWYHRKFPRVPEIDECYEDDYPCIFEADQQFKRDFKVETEIVRILRRRLSDCIAHEQPDHLERCAKVRTDFEEAELNWFIKYGDLGYRINARDAYYKQKHRLVFERRKREQEERERQQKFTSE
ncbi:NADH dehydrogenase [ubiquinone] 1 beta subcomplex subunit 10-like [Varroa jacobsoni]|uniref:NADH dehydrogenase [ubiquinone] 1 beta subcomplex subunit 10 n=1 Tax=Varroa destructor TaxID=109461 RepID=A0A7M7KRM7_VARDE|nr:NADH dehydrogenase [ubiquinone] 1 beta subcomplex subunit 10-like [Varroa destructor]XP_022696735.1 NADH dehydrogenase [ubiquinone] 1 beta subcomplex subunit 10-like [Varroa jacobsoni]